VEVAYARSDLQALIEVELPIGSTLRNAIETSHIMNKFPEIDLRVNQVGIFGKKSTLDAVLKEHDRVEIYRELIADPKAARKKAAQ
jgi:putative ubiquitin-RnfH superfamily antitoxin RatB of RatAB toxin-antitoxin module